MFISHLPPTRPNFATMNKDELWQLACNRTTPATTRRAAIRQWLFLDANPNIKPSQLNGLPTIRSENYPPTLA